MSDPGMNPVWDNLGSIEASLNVIGWEWQFGRPELWTPEIRAQLSDLAVGMKALFDALDARDRVEQQRKLDAQAAAVETALRIYSPLVPVKAPF